jgi:hypothetical protein
MDSNAGVPVHYHLGAFDGIRKSREPFLLRARVPWPTRWLYRPASPRPWPDSTACKCRLPLDRHPPFTASFPCRAPWSSAFSPSPSSYLPPARARSSLSGTPPSASHSPDHAEAGWLMRIRVRQALLEQCGSRRLELRWMFRRRRRQSAPPRAVSVSRQPVAATVHWLVRQHGLRLRRARVRCVAFFTSVCSRSA